MHIEGFPGYCGAAVLLNFPTIPLSKEHVSDEIKCFLKEEEILLNKKSGYTIYATISEQQEKHGWLKLLKSCGFTVTHKLKNPNTNNICYTLELLLGKQYSLKRV